jgi:hypothetical protein
MDRLQAEVGPRGVRRSGDALRPVRTHLAPGHSSFQQVIFHPKNYPKINQWNFLVPMVIMK